MLNPFYPTKPSKIQNPKETTRFALYLSCAWVAKRGSSLCFICVFSTWESHCRIQIRRQAGRQLRFRALSTTIQNRASQSAQTTCVVWNKSSASFSCGGDCCRTTTFHFLPFGGDVENRGNQLQLGRGWNGLHRHVRNTNWWCVIATVVGLNRRVSIRPALGLPQLL